MKAKKKWRYYCDFCKKVGGSKPGMERHELRCTANPNRVCGMCVALDQTQPKIQDLLDSLPTLQELELPHGTIFSFRVLAEGHAYNVPDIKKLRLVSGGCPACMLAALRQRGLTEIIDKDVFDYQKECSEAWKEVNHAEQRAEMESNYL